MDKDYDDELSLEEILTYKGDITGVSPGVKCPATHRLSSHLHMAGAKLLRMEKQHQDLLASNQKMQDELQKASMKQAVEIEELSKMLAIVHETEERMMGHIEAFTRTFTRT